MLECLKGVHSCGYLHRDVKPANFVRRKKNGKEFVIIDFGELGDGRAGSDYVGGIDAVPPCCVRKSGLSHGAAGPCVGVRSSM